VSEQLVRRSIVIPAAHDERSVIDPERLGRWFGGDISFEPAPGEPLTYEEDASIRHGFIIDIDEGGRFEFWWEEDSTGSLVTIEVYPDDHGTRVTITEEPATIAVDAVAPCLVRPAGFGNRPLALAG
jgi:uncharacterized protein YndB with AHSA1/START domain